MRRHIENRTPVEERDLITVRKYTVKEPITERNVGSMNGSCLLHNAAKTHQVATQYASTYAIPT